MAANKQKSHKESAGHESSRAPKPAAADLREQVFIGTSGWAYPTWKPGFYPHALPQKKFLEYYATQLNSVEVNYTFRQLPTESMLTGPGAGGFFLVHDAERGITRLADFFACVPGLGSGRRADARMDEITVEFEPDSWQNFSVGGASCAVMASCQARRTNSRAGSSPPSR